MKRLVAALALVFALAAPASAGVKATATVSVDDPTPVYGQFITLTATTDAAASFIYMECVQDGAVVGVSYSPTGSGTYSDDVGLYSPIWTSGGATCSAQVHAYLKHNRSVPIGDVLTFEVAA